MCHNPLFRLNCSNSNPFSPFLKFCINHCSLFEQCPAYKLFSLINVERFEFHFAYPAQGQQQNNLEGNFGIRARVSLRKDSMPMLKHNK